MSNNIASFIAEPELGEGAIRSDSDRDSRAFILDRLDNIPAVGNVAAGASAYSVYDPVGPILHVERRSDGGVVHHSANNEAEAARFIEKVLDSAPDTFVRAFRLQELSVHRQLAFRVELETHAK